MKEVYLGDGLYARDEGYMFWLRAPRGSVDHEVALEDPVLQAFLQFIERSRGLRITITKAEAEVTGGNNAEE